MQQSEKSQENQALLEVQVRATITQYEMVLKEHLLKEKHLRAKTTRTQVELQNWLAKYDHDISEKQFEYEHLKAHYDGEKAAMDDLERKLCEQEELFIILMAEKKKEEEKTCQEMAYKILVNRSAKVIQRAWRAYREKKSKRRGKKGKKGKSQGKK